MARIPSRKGCSLFIHWRVTSEQVGLPSCLFIRRFAREGERELPFSLVTFTRTHTAIRLLRIVWWIGSGKPKYQPPTTFRRTQANLGWVPTKLYPSDVNHSVLVPQA